ncbi:MULTISPECIES: hypothetical protein [Paenibacillus]|uniref:hypothetical protein n=1 Tax=Paenibacillus TaxID=44249 RepID=UPI000A58F860|nr:MULTISPECIES: hypothetical protein [Paenibacillus]MBE0338788.1 hypothetical protein [Paenibacillus sp. 23TSA30-6]
MDWRREWSMLVCMLLTMCSLSGCTLAEQQNAPDQIFKRAVAGIAGKETLTFKGQAGVIARNGMPVDKQFAYHGKVSNHDELTMHWSSAGAFNKRSSYAALKQGASGDGVTQERFLRLDGKWIAVTSSRIAMNGVGTLNRFNPIQELEELNALNKTIRIEAGAARGTWVVRIEPESSSAKRWLKDRLMKEMDAINPHLLQANMKQNGKNQEVQQKLNRIWAQSREDMSSQLEHSDVHAVYHLTIDRQTGLPLKLSSECKIARQEANGEGHEEALITRVAFEGYK